MFINVECNTCDAVYIGTTGRKLKDRLKNHQSAIKNTDVKSNIADHINNKDHDIIHDVNFTQPKVTYSENNYSARMFLESWDIERSKTLNKKLMNDKQTSKTSIPPVYLSLLKK